MKKTCNFNLSLKSGNNLLILNAEEKFAIASKDYNCFKRLQRLCNGENVFSENELLYLCGEPVAGMSAGSNLICAHTYTI